MGKAETRLTDKMKKAGRNRYGDRLVIIKQHGSIYARSGTHDLVGCLDGVFWSCEVKAPASYGGSVDRALADGPTALQRQFFGHVLLAGGVSGFAATVDQFMEILEVAESRAISPAGEIVCTCVGECEWGTTDGCYYCRHANPDLPCPNLDQP